MNIVDSLWQTPLLKYDWEQADSPQTALSTDEEILKTFDKTLN